MNNGPANPCRLPVPPSIILPTDTQQVSPLNGCMWRGRKGSGVVNCVEGLGMLQHLRDSRLIPYRFGCNCLYKHPGLKHLLDGRHSRQEMGFSSPATCCTLRRGPGRLNEFATLTCGEIIAQRMTWLTAGSCFKAGTGAIYCCVKFALYVPIRCASGASSL